MGTCFAFEKRPSCFHRGCTVSPRLAPSPAPRGAPELSLAPSPAHGVLGLPRFGHSGTRWRCPRGCSAFPRSASPAASHAHVRWLQDTLLKHLLRAPASSSGCLSALNPESCSPILGTGRLRDTSLTNLFCQSVAFHSLTVSEGERFNSDEVRTVLFYGLCL